MNMTPKISDLMSFFRKESRKAFNFLFNQYGFKMSRGDSSTRHVSVVYRGELVGVDICFEIHENIILIALYKLINGKIPDILEDHDYWCYLENYLSILHKEDFRFKEAGCIKEQKDIHAFLKKTSRIIREELKDFLKGDFTIFDKAVSSV